MKKGWKLKKIKDIGTVIGGTTPNTNIAEYWNGSLCWISPAELDGSHYLYDSRKKITEAAVKAKSLKLLPAGTVILSSRAPIGKVVINKVPTYCNQGFKCIVCGEEIFNEYLYWWFWGKTEYLNSLGTGATFKEISKKVVEEIEIPLPPLSEQEEIVRYLDKAFMKIDAMKEKAEEALEEAKALFQSALTEMMKPKKGWEEKKLGEVCNKITDGSHNPPKGIALSKYKMLSSQNIDYGCMNSQNVRYLSKEDYEVENKRTNAQKGDVLLTIVGTIGRACVLKGDEGNLTFQRSVAVIKPKEIINSYYLMYDFWQLNELMNNLAHGAAQKGFYLKQLSQLPILLPPLPEQEAIVSRLDAISERVKIMEENYSKTVEECDAMKQAMLREIFE